MIQPNSPLLDFLDTKKSDDNKNAKNVIIFF